MLPDDSSPLAQFRSEELRFRPNAGRNYRLSRVTRELEIAAKHAGIAKLQVQLRHYLTTGAPRRLRRARLGRLYCFVNQAGTETVHTGCAAAVRPMSRLRPHPGEEYLVGWQSCRVPADERSRPCLIDGIEGPPVL